MSVIAESYGCGAKFKVKAYFGIVDITPKQVETVQKIVGTAFKNAENEIEKQLYKSGLMTCNAILCDIAEMREHGTDLIQAYIKELDEKYNNEVSV